MLAEYGGYLPLELAHGNEHYDQYSNDMLRLNSGRTALYCALVDAKVKKLYLPLYMCDSISQPVNSLKIDCEYYRIDHHFKPINVNLKENECILWANYFGTMTQITIGEIVGKYKNLILDNTQAFFAEPIEDVYNIYSCRKFFGVCDGAYLIKKGLKELQLEQDISYERAQYILKSIELGTNTAYCDHLNSEELLDGRYLKMSKLTQRILSSIDYPVIQQKRKDNFLELYNRLQDFNELDVNPKTDTPMIYPLLVTNQKLRQMLIENKIYVPTWWRHVVELTDSNDFENRLTKYLIPLPIDQRYDKHDMYYISNKISDFLEGKK